MSETIRTILQELYELEPELKSREAELAPLVLKLIQAKPDIKPSAAFVATLKLKLNAKEQELMSINPENNSLSVWLKLASFMRQPFMLTGVAVIAFVLILVSSMPGVLRRFKAPTGTFTPSVSRLPAGSFGSLLATTSGVNPTAGLGAGSAEKMATPVAPLAAQADSSAVSFNETSTISAAPAGLGGGDRAMIYPYPAYTYTYSGEKISDLPAQVDVFKRVKNSGQLVNAGFLRNFDTGNIKLDSFAGANLSQVTFMEDKEFGYAVTIDFVEGNVNIFSNWRRWPQPFNDCRDEACYKSLQLTPENVPADTELISLANSWLNDHGISTTNYGQPFVQNEWRVYYNQTVDKSQAYVPDVITIIYPFFVNGQPVYESGGNQAGMGVNINVRYNRVSDVWNLISQQYQSSSYEAETDFDALLKYVTAGNQGYPVPLMYPETDNGMQKTELQLGTPQVGYMHYWTYLNNENQELFLPALVFPVLNPPTEAYAYLPKQVVIPLVKEYLQSSYPIDGPIRIMPASPAGGPAVPMTEPGATGSGSSSAGSAGVAEPTVVEPEPAIEPAQ